MEILLKEKYDMRESQRIAEELNLDIDIVDFLLAHNFNEHSIKLLTTSEYVDLSNFTTTNIQEGAKKLISFLAEDNPTIYIRSDYDSDGMNAAFIAKSTLDIIAQILELDLVTIILDVDRTDGYGINKKDCLKMINDKAENKLCLILDNGITKADCTDYLYKYDIESIIIDHHIPRDEGSIPYKGSIVIDPHYNDKTNENAKGLCGAALTYFFFKEVMKMLGDTSDFMNVYTANAAIATITDCMPNTDLNIALVGNGMKDINSKEASAAINHWKSNKRFSLVPKDVAFELGPQLNACGRMHKTHLAIDFLFEEDDIGLFDLYNEIEELNNERKQIEKNMMAKIDTFIDPSDKVIMAILDNNVDGILGSLAGKLLNRYGKPVILFVSSNETGKLTGSARSLAPINLHELFTEDKVAKYIESFGGHAQAAGIFIQENNFDNLKNVLNETIKKNKKYDLEDLNKDKKIEVDMVVPLDYISQNSLDKYKKVLFFNDLKEPLLLVPNVEVLSTRTSKNVENICFNLVDDSIELNHNGIGKEIWVWGFASEYQRMGKPKKVHLIGRLSSMFGSATLDVIDFIDVKECEI